MAIDYNYTTTISKCLINCDYSHTHKMADEPEFPNLIRQVAEDALANIPPSSQKINKIELTILKFDKEKNCIEYKIKTERGAPVHKINFNKFHRPTAPSSTSQEKAQRPTISWEKIYYESTLAFFRLTHNLTPMIESKLNRLPTIAAKQELLNSLWKPTHQFDTSSWFFYAATPEAIEKFQRAANGAEEIFHRKLTEAEQIYLLDYCEQVAELERGGPATPAAGGDIFADPQAREELKTILTDPKERGPETWVSLGKVIDNRRPTWDSKENDIELDTTGKQHYVTITEVPTSDVSKDRLLFGDEVVNDMKKYKTVENAFIAGTALAIGGLIAVFPFLFFKASAAALFGALPLFISWSNRYEEKIKQHLNAHINQIRNCVLSDNDLRVSTQKINQKCNALKGVYARYGLKKEDIIIVDSLGMPNLTNFEAVQKNNEELKRKSGIIIKARPGLPFQQLTDSMIQARKRNIKPCWHPDMLRLVVQQEKLIQQMENAYFSLDHKQAITEAEINQNLKKLQKLGDEINRYLRLEDAVR